MTNFEYIFENETGILFKNYYGEITLEDITQSWIYAFENNLIPSETKGFVLDYRQATFMFHPEEHRKVSEFYRNNLQVFGNKRIAVITDNPKDITIPILVELDDNGYSSKPFATIQSALNWVIAVKSF